MQQALERTYDIAPDFSARYQIVIANTEALRRKVYRVRHQVFCSELGYDMSQSRGHEFDAYDASSLHVLLRQRNGASIGCFRLVMPQPEGRIWLPFDEYGVPHVDPRLFDWSGVNRQRTVEVSRLALNAARRGGRADKDIGASDPYLATAMFYAVTALSLQLGMQNLFMVIEPRLGRLISRYGFKLDQISPPFEYYGQRATFATHSVRMREELAALKTPWRNLYDVIEAQLFAEKTRARPRKTLAHPASYAQAPATQPATADMAV